MYKGVFTITPHDSNEQAGAPFRGFMVNTGGTAYIDPQLELPGSTNAKVNLTAGVIYPIGVTRVRSTGTSAEGFIGLR